MVLENNITPFQDFSSRLLAYAIAGLTMVGSVLVCRIHVYGMRGRYVPFLPIEAWLQTE